MDKHIDMTDKKKQPRPFTPPRLKTQGKLPVITAGSADLGTPDDNNEV